VNGKNLANQNSVHCYTTNKGTGGGQVGHWRQKKSVRYVGRKPSKLEATQRNKEKDFSSPE
jgi:hypothetical protein